MIVEAVACSVEDALIAEGAGASRIELCSAIELGGLTPSLGLVREVLDKCRHPIMAIVRPRAGGFNYTPSELATMRRDIEVLTEAGVHGVVLGVLRDDQTIDTDACAGLVEGLNIETVFHRAFDLTPDPRSSLQELIALGFTRVLTSGHSATALEGAASIRELIELADGRIEILAGGGIRPGNVLDVIREGGVDQIHLGPFRQIDEDSPAQFGTRSALDGAALKMVVDACTGRA